MRKILALMLALALVMTTGLTCSFADTMSPSETAAYIKSCLDFSTTDEIKYDGDCFVSSCAPITLYKTGEFWDGSTYSEQSVPETYPRVETCDAYNAITKDTKFVVKNISSEEVVSVAVWAKPYSFDGTKYVCDYFDTKYGYYDLFGIQNDGKFLNELEGAASKMLAPGESLEIGFDSFYLNGGATKINMPNDAIYYLHISANLQPDSTEETVVTYNGRFLCKIDEETVAAMAVPEKVETGIFFDEGYRGDDGISYNYTIGNATNEKMEGCFALLSYFPEKFEFFGEETYSAQIHSFDINLNAGKSQKGTLTSEFDISKAKNIWIKFESKAERDAFLKSAGLIQVQSTNGDRYTILGDEGEAFLKDNFGITLK